MSREKFGWVLGSWVRWKGLEFGSECEGGKKRLPGKILERRPRK
jgi:hypothetical protein